MARSGYRVAREAFQEELERLAAEGWFTWEGKDPGKLGRQAARWVMADELERRQASASADEGSPTSGSGRTAQASSTA